MATRPTNFLLKPGVPKIQSFYAKHLFLSPYNLGKDNAPRSEPAAPLLTQPNPSLVYLSAHRQVNDDKNRGLKINGVAGRYDRNLQGATPTRVQPFNGIKLVGDRAVAHSFSKTPLISKNY